MIDENEYKITIYGQYRFHPEDEWKTDVIEHFTIAAKNVKEALEKLIERYSEINHYIDSEDYKRISATPKTLSIKVRKTNEIGETEIKMTAYVLTYPKRNSRYIIHIDDIVESDLVEWKKDEDEW